MSEITGHDAKEVRNSSVDNFKKIKPEKEVSTKEVNDFWASEFKKGAEAAKAETLEKSEQKDHEFGGKYNSYKERLDITPKRDSLNGQWTGDRGESMFIPSEASEESKAAKEKLAEYNQIGIEYINAEPDFSKCSEATVQIDNMTVRLGKNGNYVQADKKCAALWNEQKKDGKSDWTQKDIYNYRQDNKLTWHERCDTKTMDLVPREIHEFFRHSGGVSECMARDRIAGGIFDE